jgi:copper transport protein
MVLFTFSLSAHGAALGGAGGTLAVIWDWLHVAATVTWLGGLLPLFLILRSKHSSLDSTIPLKQIIPRFSRLALYSVAILAASGTFSYLVHISDLGLVLATTYGRSLLIKTSLFVLLLGLGAINLLILSPRLERRGARLAVAFKRTVSVEMVLGSTLLLFAAVMLSVSPSRSAWEAHQNAFALLQLREFNSGGVKMDVYIAPAKEGYNEIAVDVIDQRHGAEQTEPEVIIRLSNLDQDSGELQIATEYGAEGRFMVQGNYFSSAGLWEMTVILRRPGFDNVVFVTSFDIRHH